MSRKTPAGGASSASGHFDRAIALHRAGRHGEALAACDRTLAAHPRHAPALHLSAVLLHQAGRPVEATARITRSLAIDDRAADAWSNAGLIHESGGRPLDAMRSYRRALELEPGLASAWVNLASLHLLQDEPAAAEHAARRALALAPSRGALVNLAMAVAAQGRHAEVLRLLDDPRPSEAAVAGLRCQAMKALGDIEGARSVLDDALLQFDDARLRIERARLVEGADEALAFDDYRAVLRSRDVDDETRETALSEAINLAKRRALWSLLPPLQSAFRDGVVSHAARGDASGLTPFCFLSDDSTRAEQRAAAASWSRRFRTGPAAGVQLSTGRLRIGYLSADLHDHATGILAVGLFEQHDRARFEVVAYSSGPDDGSALRHRLVAAFDRFVDVRGWDDARIARAITEDRIDILVDLKGHTDQATTGVVARRPAPIVVSYLGYPGTMGASFVDYLIGDAIVTPLSEAGDFSETLVLLPDSYQVNDDRRRIGATPSRASLALPEQAVVLCGFNASWKIGPDVLAAWSAILLRAPHAVLWMQSREPGSATTDRWRAALQAGGIDPRRLVCAPHRPHEEYLALLRHADLFLDAWPYNAHTTASDALWAGCPLLTRRGETFAGRVAESLLAAVGRRDWVAADRAQYVEQAIRLANNPSRLTAMRRALEADVAASALYDTVATTRAIETAYEEMAVQYRAGRRAPITVAR